MRSANNARRFRSAFNAEQTDLLERVFAQTPYPDVTTRENLSQVLDLNDSRIQVWFSNRRARTRKATVTSAQPDETPPPVIAPSPMTVYTGKHNLYSYLRTTHVII
jgi:hypothetical protein